MTECDCLPILRCDSVVFCLLLACGADESGTSAAADPQGTTTTQSTTNSSPQTGASSTGGVGTTGAAPSSTGDDDAADATSSTGAIDDGVAPETDGGSEDSSGTAAAECEAPAGLEVLFIGNSYTHTHDMPGVVSALGDRAGLSLDTTRLTTGGMDLQFHVENPDTLEAINDKSWDYVVIQGHSLDTIDQLDSFLTHGQTLVQWVEAAGAQPLLYETWARAPAHPLYAADFFGPDNPDEMQAVIREGYEMLSDLTGADIVPVGDAWQALWASEHIDSIFPWGGDDHHPSEEGAYLTASVFFVSLTGVSLDAVTGDAPIDNDDADVLHQVAESIVSPCVP